MKRGLIKNSALALVLVSSVYFCQGCETIANNMDSNGNITLYRWESGGRRSGVLHDLRQKNRERNLGTEYDYLLLPRY